MVRTKSRLHLIQLWWTCEDGHVRPHSVALLHDPRHFWKDTPSALFYIISNIRGEQMVVQHRIWGVYCRWFYCTSYKVNDKISQLLSYMGIIYTKWECVLGFRIQTNHKHERINKTKRLSQLPSVDGWLADELFICGWEVLQHVFNSVCGNVNQYVVTSGCEVQT